MTERDDAVSRRYRELPAEEPPRALDEAILAASRRAADSRPAPLVAPTGRKRWYVPLAAAAVIVLSIGLTLRVQLEQAKKDEGSPVARLEEKPQEEKPVAKAAPERRARQAPAQSRAEAPKPFPAEQAAREERAAPAATPAPAMAQMRAAPAPRSDDLARDSAAGALSGGATAKRMQEAVEPPEKALERIAELRKAGKDEEADKALAEFRKRYPGYTLSDEMRARVERAKAVVPAR